MTNSIPFILQGNNIVLFIKGEPVNIDSTHMNYKAVKEAIKVSDWASVESLAKVATAVAEFSSGRVTVIDEQLFYDGTLVHNALSQRIMAMLSEGFNINPFCTLMENIEANPSYRARQELFGFLEACSLPITEDGHFIAYKKIRLDWMDCHSGTIDNSIGAKPTMNRRDVNEDPTQTCSAGLHVCSYSYLNSYGGDRIVAVKVNPRDVVSVPVDYNQSKMRVCMYEVIEELEFTEAMRNDVLSNRGSVVSEDGTAMTGEFDLIAVLEEMWFNDFVDLCDYLGLEPADYEDQTDLIDEVGEDRLARAIDMLELF